LKLQTQLDIVKYSLAVQKNFRYGASRGRMAPSVNLGPPISRKVQELESLN